MPYLYVLPAFRNLGDPWSLVIRRTETVLRETLLSLLVILICNEVAAYTLGIYFSHRLLVLPSFLNLCLYLSFLYNLVYKELWLWGISLRRFKFQCYSFLLSVRRFSSQTKTQAVLYRKHELCLMHMWRTVPFFNIMWSFFLTLTRIVYISWSNGTALCSASRFDCLHT